MNTGSMNHTYILAANLDLSDGNPSDGAKVQGWQETVGEDNQRWFLTTQQEGYDAGFMFVAQGLLR